MYKEGKDSFFDDSIVDYCEKNSNFWLNEEQFEEYKNTNFCNKEEKILARGIFKNGDQDNNNDEKFMELILTPFFLIYTSVKTFSFFIFPIIKFLSNQIQNKQIFIFL